MPRDPYEYRDPIWRMLIVVIAFYLLVLTLFFMGVFKV